MGFKGTEYKNDILPDNFSLTGVIQYNRPKKRNVIKVPAYFWANQSVLSLCLPVNHPEVESRKVRVPVCREMMLFCVTFLVTRLTHSWAHRSGWFDFSHVTLSSCFLLLQSVCKSGRNSTTALITYNYLKSLNPSKRNSGVSKRASFFN